MAVRQVLATAPPAGVDWSFTVPGQWLPYLYGVTAVLDTALPVTGFADTSGGGRPAVLNPASLGTLGVQGPFSAGLNNYACGTPGRFVGGGAWLGLTALSAAFAVPAGTLVWWEQIFSDPPTATSVIVEVRNAGGTGVEAVQVGASGNPYSINAVANAITTHVYPNVAGWGGWHHFAMTWDGVTCTLYVDGASQGGFAAAAPAFGATAQVSVGGGRDGDAAPNARQAGVALFNAALGGAAIAGMAAATGSAAAYQIAVLANAPVGLWLLNDIPMGPSRIVTLKVSDGTHTVAQFPAGFVSATARSFTWSWQALGPGAQSSTDGTTNSVPIPELRVDAGYVISSVTLDLSAADQWGPITLWFDDGTGPGPPGGPGSDPLAFRSLLLLG